MSCITFSCQMYPTFIVGKTLQAFQKTYQVKLVSLLCPEQYKSMIQWRCMEKQEQLFKCIYVLFCFFLSYFEHILRDGNSLINAYSVDVVKMARCCCTALSQP